MSSRSLECTFPCNRLSTSILRKLVHSRFDNLGPKQNGIGAFQQFSVSWDEQFTTFTTGLKKTVMRSRTATRLVFLPNPKTVALKRSACLIFFSRDQRLVKMHTLPLLIYPELCSRCSRRLSERRAKFLHQWKSIEQYRKKNNIIWYRRSKSIHKSRHRFCRNRDNCLVTSNKQ